MSLRFRRGSGNDFALLRIGPAEQVMKDTARRAARLYRARAERCYRLARECPDVLGMEIMTGVGNGLLEKARRLEQRAGGPAKLESARVA